MVEMALCPSVALLRSLSRLAASRQCLRQVANRHQRALHVSRALGQEERPQKSFAGQLYESTAQRVQRERAEQERFVEMRSKRGKGGFAAATASRISTTAESRQQRQLTLTSYPHLYVCWLHCRHQ